MAVFTGDVVRVLEYGTDKDLMAVVLDWNGCGMAARFFFRRE